MGGGHARSYPGVSPPQNIIFSRLLYPHPGSARPQLPRSRFPFLACLPLGPPAASPSCRGIPPDHLDGFWNWKVPPLLSPFTISTGRTGVAMPSWVVDVPSHSAATDTLVGRSGAWREVPFLFLNTMTKATQAFLGVCCTFFVSLSSACTCCYHTVHANTHGVYPKTNLCDCPI